MPVRAILIAAVLLVGAASCISVGRARVEGDRVYPPPGSSLALLAKQQGGPELYFTKFTGTVPPAWPKGIALPESFQVLMKDFSILQADGNYGYRVIQTRGIARGTPDELADYFREQIKGTELALTSDEAVAAVKPPPQAKGRRSPLP